MQLKEAIRSFDWVLTGTALLLASLGMAMLLSTTSEGDLISGLFIRQGISLGIALGVYFVISLFPYHHVRRHAITLFVAGLAVMILISQVAPVIRGTSSRVELFSGFQVQPSEFMKIALIILLAWFFSKRPANTSNVIVSAVITGIASIIVALEPDVGVAALMASAWVGLIVYLGAPWKLLSSFAVLGALGFMAAWKWFFAAYQKARIQIFLDPTADPLGAGYNVTQSIVALGSGGLTGRGLGHGPQSQLQFLPEQHTDFILASIGEELGFVGIVLLVGLYSILLWRINKISRVTKDNFGKYISVGAFLLLIVSLFVSAGMNMGLLPVTGIPLPLVSYGGSNLLSTMVLLGLVQSVHIYSRWVRKAPSELQHFT